ncbi:MAG: metallophosphoesterase [Candidatus Thiodiazotropha endolucinida]
MRWLHLSDLHIGRNNESQEVALDSLVSAVKDNSENKPFDLVLLTGDLAFSGKDEEYSRFEEIVLKPILNCALFKDAYFISVPGNHDVDFDSALPITWDNLGPTRQEKFFYLDEDGRKIRNQRSVAFKAYSEFIKRNNFVGVDPLAEPAAINTYSFNEKKVKFLTTVTSFFSDKEVPDEKLSPAPLHAMRHLLKDHQQGDLLFILGHHPKDWFTKHTSSQFWTLLIDNYALYMHGHLHQLHVEHANYGLATLGFGAGYQAPAERPSTNYYRNSFSICELDDELHISVISWDSSKGRWVYDNALPPEFVVDSKTLRRGFTFSLPTTTFLNPDYRKLEESRQLLRIEQKVHRCIWLAENNNKVWTHILQLLDYINEDSKMYLPAPHTMPPGHHELRVHEKHGLKLVYAVSAHGDVVNYEQIEKINTQLDTNAFDSCIIITLGEIAEDARELGIRLADKKPINIIDGEQIAKELLDKLDPSLKHAINMHEVRETILELIIHEDGVFALVVDFLHRKWFVVYSQDGNLVRESSQVIYNLRESQPLLKEMAYGCDKAQSKNASETKDIEVFKEDIYLNNCYSYFNDIKYAPLAALGYKFSNTSLDEIYIPANADYNSNSSSTESLERTVSEFIDALNIDASQKDQLARQLRSSYGLSRTSEVGAAQKLYKKYSNILVLGDPGSGKTCFVKHEILLYCKPNEKGDDWYKNHIPVYLPLSEAARLLPEHNDLLEICTIINARYALNLTKSALYEKIGEGLLAFFFDGLDEIGSIEDRINLLSLIDKLMSKYSRMGNRFVLTSRPAAIQPVDIPEDLKHLQLKGLSEEEIRILASRVVSNRIQDNLTTELEAEERELINRLIEDCKQTPGIRRIARNPLLLTLLVLVYANSGALFARRHVVYSQAVKTLISVRNRSLQSQVLSESDLRIRLGTLAFEILNRTMGEIPLRSEVQALLAPHINSSPKQDLQLADKFIQEVAEATGILVIHQRGNSKEHDVLSFMHYSFLEYYAAIGLLQREYMQIIPNFALNPRWSEILTLLVGILSEQSDISELLLAISQEKSDTDRISKKRLLFCMDCALECDVPPERSQSLIIDLLEESIINGPVRISLELRVEIAKRLSLLLLNTKSSHIITSLLSGMENDDPCVSAAYVDLIAHLDEEISLETVGIEIFERTFKRPQSVIRCACIEALQLKPELRTDTTIKELQRCLRRGFLEKHATLRAVENITVLINPLRSDIFDLLNDDHSVISNAAARCILSSGIFDNEASGDRPILDKSLRVWQHGAQPRLRSKLSVWVDQEHISELINSNISDKIELGIRYLSLIERQERFVYQKIITNLKKHTEHRIISACLQALRQSPKSLSLVTIADVDYIISLLDFKHRDVRIEAIRTLELLPSDDQIITALQQHFDKHTEDKFINNDETEVTLNTLTSHALKRSNLRNDLVIKILTNFVTHNRNSFGNKKEQEFHRQTLRSCEDLGGTVDNHLSSQLLNVAKDYRAPRETRRQAIKTYGKLVEPSQTSARELLSILRSQDTVLRHARYDATLHFVKKCRGKIAFIRSIYREIPNLINALCKAWDSDFKHVTDRIDHRTLGNLRKCIIEIEELRISYEEFAQQVHTSTPIEQVKIDFDQ